jgi:hypothetical protein
MMKTAFTFASITALAGAFVALPAPAVAQQRNSVAEIIVFGSDPCPRSTDDQLVICRRVPESYRYRLPESYRPTSPQESDSWANRAKVLETVGDTGTFSCSPVGPGGYTGCLTQVIKQARSQRRQQAEDSTPPED